MPLSELGRGEILAHRVYKLFAAEQKLDAEGVAELVRCEWRVKPVRRAWVVEEY